MILCSCIFFLHQLFFWIISFQLQLYVHEVLASFDIKICKIVLRCVEKSQILFPHDPEMKDHESFWTGLFLKHSHTVAWLQPLQTSCVTPWPADHCCRSTNRPETIKKRDESVSAPGGDRERVSRGPEHCTGNLILGNLPCDLFSSVQCVSPDLTSCTCRRSSSGFKTQQKDWRQMDVWCLSHHSEGVTLVKQQQEQHLLHLLLVVNTFPNDLRSHFHIFTV